MEIRDWFILIFTFIVGIFSGMYIYTTAYAPNYVKEKAPEAQGVEFSIIGAAYGGMTLRDYEHPAFELESDGSYEFVPGGVGKMSSEDGVIPNILLTELQSALLDADLKEYAAPAPLDKVCVLASDGTEYGYSIEFKGKEYILDTCSTDFTHDTALGKVLRKLWIYMDAPDETRISVRNAPSVVADESEDEKGWHMWSLYDYFEKGFKDAGF